MRASKSSDKPAPSAQGLRSVSELLADLPGPVQAIREATPQALHHYTQASIR